MGKVLSLPPKSFIIDEEYGYRNHIWIDKDNNYDESFNFGALLSVDSIKTKFGGRIIKDVELCFRRSIGEEWVSLNEDNHVPDDFQGLMAIFVITENGSVKIYDGDKTKWIFIDLE